MNGITEKIEAVDIEQRIDKLVYKPVPKIQRKKRKPQKVIKVAIVVFILCFSILFPFFLYGDGGTVEGATFGYSGAGGTRLSLGGYYTSSWGLVADGDGTIDNISGLLYNGIAGTDFFMFAIYEYVDYSSSYAGNLLGNTTIGSASIPASDTWYTLPMNNTVNVVNGTKYYIVATSNGTDSVKISCTSSAGYSVYESGHSDWFTEDPWVGESTSGSRRGLYASYTVGSSNNAPVNSNPVPSDNAVKQSLNPTLNITVNDTDGDTLNQTYRTNASSTWVDIAWNNNTANATLSNSTNVFTSYNTKYWWSSNLSDGTDWANNTYNFTTDIQSSFDLYGLEGSDKNFTWTGDDGDAVWSNATSGAGGTGNLSMIVNSSDNASVIFVYCGDLDASITANNLELSVSSDNSSFGSLGAFTSGGSNITINETNWNAGSMGTNPFTGAGITDKTDYIYLRLKLSIPGGVGTGTYAQNNWAVYIEEYI